VRQLEFGTENRSSIVLIEPAVIALLSHYRQVNRNAREAGGVLLGYMRGPHFHILLATSPGLGDRRSRTSFHRSDKSHYQEFLSARKNDPLLAYLGDWHSHPEDTPTPSSLDQSEWRIIKKYVGRRCVCLIQGRQTVACYLVLSKNNARRLEQIRDSTSQASKKGFG